MELQKGTLVREFRIKLWYGIVRKILFIIRLVLCAFLANQEYRVTRS